MEFNGTFFASIISFLVFVFLMNKLLYIPVRKIVKERKGFIEGNYSSAEDNNKKAEELNSEREDRLSDAKEDARVKYNELVADYKSQRADIVKTAQEDARTELNNVYESLNNVSNDAKEALKGRMTDLANDIVEKVLGYRSEVNGFDNDKVNEILYHQEG